MRDNHLNIMNQDGILGSERDIFSVTFDQPLVYPGTLTITVDEQSLCNLSPENAAQLITSLQEDSCQ